MRAIYTLAVSFGVFGWVGGVSAAGGAEHATDAIARLETRLQAAQPAAQFLISDGRIERIYGAALAFGDGATHSATTFVQEYAGELYGVETSDLVLYGIQDVMLGKFTAVYFVQQFDSLPVHGAGLTVLVRHDAGDAVVLVSGDVFPLRDAKLPAFAITSDDAIAAVAKIHPTYRFGPAAAVVLVRDVNSDGQPDIVPVHRFTGGNDDLVDPQRFEFMVDARDTAGRIVSQESQIDYEDIAGTVIGNASPGWLPDRPDNLPVPRPIDQVRVRVAGGNTANTTATGAFTVPHAGVDAVNVETSLSGTGETQSGPWARIVNQGTGGTIGGVLSVSPPGPAAFLLNSTPSEFLTAQVNGFIGVTEIHDFAKSINPNYPGLDFQMAVNVNIASSCNAFYDRDTLSVNFYRSGGGCPNMSYSSVVYHEYGHHIVNRAYTAAGRAQPPSSYHEGFADTSAYMLMDDPCLGYGFFGGNTCLRSGVNTWMHQCNGGGHDCGGVASGSFWDTRLALGVTEPGVALDIVRELYLNSILLVPTGIFPALTIDVLTLDDDDTSITNGTPHYEEIAAGFGAHNLDAPVLIDLTTALPDGTPSIINPGGGTRFRVEATPVASQANPAQCFLHYSTGGAFTAVPLEAISVSQLDAVFPAIACTTDLRFYVTVTSDRGNVFRLPTNAPTTTYAATSAYALDQTFSDNFQTDQGWTVEEGGALANGLWERGVPAGNPISGVPSADSDGSGMCYLTGAQPSRNVDGGSTTLISPPFYLNGDTPLLEYALWFNNSTGSNPGQDTLVVSVSNDDGQNWTPIETFGPTGPGSAGGWNARAVRIVDILPLTGPVRVQFFVADTGGASVVEAAVDAVRVRDFTRVANDTPGDLNCDGLINFFDIDPFVLALFDPAGYAAAYSACRIENADVNDDGAVNFFDIDGFVALIFP